MSCECVRCSECGGQGTVYFAFPGPDRGGKYLGNSRNDDLDEMERCYACNGSGIVEACNECLESERRAEENDDCGRVL